MKPHTPKVFCIGLSKTGTTSLARALEILGYKTRDYLGVTRYIAGDLSSINLEDIDANDAFTDTPIPSFYQQLDTRYPGSKFILTTRDMDGWLKSCKKQFTKRIVARQNEATSQLHTDLYGCFEFDAEKYAAGYTRFVNGVMDYFKDRPGDLLVMEICGGDNWEKLCAFLDKPVPDIPFPVTNVSAIQWMDILKIVSIAKQAGKETRKICKNDSGSRHRKPKRLLTRWVHACARSLAALVRQNGERRRQLRMHNAARAAERIIVNGLQQLNPSLPIISPQNADIPYADRMNWSYFWLIDPLGGTEKLHDQNNDLTINIALIEGGKPVWGVVYYPMDDTVYYAKGASGSYKIKGEGSPEILTHPGTAGNSDNVVALSGNSVLAEDIKGYIESRMKDYTLIFTGNTKAACMLAEGKAAMHVNQGTTMEWETAAAHAIARSSGSSICDYNTGRELVYNKEHLVNDSFVAE